MTQIESAQQNGSMALQRHSEASVSFDVCGSVVNTALISLISVDNAASNITIMQNDEQNNIT